MPLRPVPLEEIQIGHVREGDGSVKKEKKEKDQPIKNEQITPVFVRYGDLSFYPLDFW